MLQKEDGLVVFVSAMDPFNEGMMTDVLRVIAAVCLVADGYVFDLVFIVHVFDCIMWCHNLMSDLL